MRPSVREGVEVSNDDDGVRVQRVRLHQKPELLDRFPPRPLPGLGAGLCWTLEKAAATKMMIARCRVGPEAPRVFRSHSGKTFFLTAGSAEWRRSVSLTNSSAIRSQAWAALKKLARSAASSARRACCSHFAALSRYRCLFRLPLMGCPGRLKVCGRRKSPPRRPAGFCTRGLGYPVGPKRWQGRPSAGCDRFVTMKRRHSKGQSIFLLCGGWATAAASGNGC